MGFWKKLKKGVKKIGKTIAKPIVHPIATVKKIEKGAVKTIAHPIHALKRGATAVKHAATDPRKLTTGALFVATGGTAAILGGAPDAGMMLAESAGFTVGLKSKRFQKIVKKVPLIGQAAKPAFSVINKTNKKSWKDVGKGVAGSIANYGKDYVGKIPGGEILDGIKRPLKAANFKMNTGGLLKGTLTRSRSLLPSGSSVKPGTAREVASGGTLESDNPTPYTPWDHPLMAAPRQRWELKGIS